MYVFRAILIVSFFIKTASSAKILAVFPMNSKSHQMVFRPLILELLKKGHEVVLFTTDSMTTKDRPIENLTEVSMHYMYDNMQSVTKRTFSYPWTQALESLMGTWDMGRGVVINSQNTRKGLLKYHKRFLKCISSSTSFVDTLTNKNKQHYDLIFIEQAFPVTTVLGKVYNAPLIAMSSFYGVLQFYEWVGAPTRHPYLHPYVTRNRIYNLTLLEKIQQVYLELDIWFGIADLNNAEDEFLRKHFGNNAPKMSDLGDYVDLMFVNANPIFEGNRVVPPNVIRLGGLHLQPVKELPKELKSYLDKSKRGVIYVNLGTNCRVGKMTAEFLQVFLDTFAVLPYDILWTTDKEIVGWNVMPKNVRQRRWFPQRDLLMHPNIKAFVTHAGLQSTDEAIEAEVPLVAIPILVDQWFNAEQYVRLGIGIQLDPLTVTSEELVAAVTKVATDSSYRKNIKRLNAQIKDQPETPLERAVWWTEYLLRHGSAKHLRPVHAKMSWMEYLFIDIILFLAVISVVLSASLWFIIKYIRKLYYYSQKRPHASSNDKTLKKRSTLEQHFCRRKYYD